MKFMEDFVRETILEIGTLIIKENENRYVSYYYHCDEEYAAEALDLILDELIEEGGYKIEMDGNLMRIQW